MSGGKQHNAVSIPVNREQRSFEKQRRDLLTGLEHGGGAHRGNSIAPYTEDWPSTVDNWIDSSWKRWDDDMRRLRRGMFALLVSLAIQYSERMGSLDVPSTGSVNDFLKDAYEVGEDGKVHFKVRFDAQGFAPQDINVTSSENRVTVHAKKETTTDGRKCSREFCRMVQLPKSIDDSQLKCRMTDDGVLMLEAPVKVDQNQSLTLNESGQVAVRPKSDNQIKAVPASQALVAKGVHGLSYVDDGSGGKRLHVEVPVDPVYKPEDLFVNVDSNRVVVSGRHHKQKSDQHGRSSSFAEFSQSYAIPETVDPLSVSAQVVGNTLVLEAPLEKQHAITH
ncbi:putative heat shock protein-HSP20/alpha crystallin family [Schistosoma mansoni]|uniref:putative heat shock protein-HSP20/alpha crystallin family n=1 Tax=Schistosoma mansoni TaxID=6183 RepID=UPI00022DC537|nr:putative heat shock protein-HSP20/alpha crystallin family [Schistosoma mansoni]|eukprot:XP_018649076.1 putative heat shock protein-HSP20/alpha crystallin family [Schistosoma mansoni]